MFSVPVIKLPKNLLARMNSTMLKVRLDNYSTVTPIIYFDYVS